MRSLVRGSFFCWWENQKTCLPLPIKVFYHLQKFQSFLWVECAARASFLLVNVRLLNDQTLENSTGVGAPPWRWPVDEQVIDLLHKAIYAFVTGVVADRLISGPDLPPKLSEGQPNPEAESQGASR